VALASSENTSAKTNNADSRIRAFLLSVLNGNRSCQPFDISDNGLKLLEALLKRFQPFLFLSSALYFSLGVFVQSSVQLKDGLFAGIGRFARCRNGLRAFAAQHWAFSSEQPINGNSQLGTEGNQGIWTRVSVPASPVL